MEMMKMYKCESCERLSKKCKKLKTRVDSLEETLEIMSDKQLMKRLTSKSKGDNISLEELRKKFS